MNKIIVFLIMLLFINTAQADADICQVVCPIKDTNTIKDETFINKYTGMSFLSKKMVELAVEKEINSELNSKANAELKIFNIKSLKNGEFKGIKLHSESIKYKALSLSDFEAETICSYNKIVYKNNRLYYPFELPFKYRANITNKDIQNILSSEDFQKEINQNPVKINGIKLFTIQPPSVEIKNGNIYFRIPLKTMFAKISISFKANIEVENNKIVLKNITLGSKSNIIDDSMLPNLIDYVNPITYRMEEFNSKFCKIHITKAKIVNDKIETEGIFIINKNYGGENE